MSFVVGSTIYIDTVDCDVAPLSACHLLLGRPWQFDLDATHGGRSNNYSFVHKGVTHVLKPMPEAAIKAEVFATSKVKKKVLEITPKPRTALFQEGENGVNIPTVNIDVRESAVNCAEPIKPAIQFGSTFDNADKNGTSALALLYAVDNSNIPNNARKDDVIIDLPIAASENKCKNSETALNFVKVQKNQLGSLAIHVKENEDNMAIIGGTASSTKEGFEFISKPRTALFKEGEDDEPMAPQNIPIENSCVVLNIAAGNSLISSGLQFGAFSFGEKYSKDMDKFTAAGLSSNIIFRGALLSGKVEKRKPRKYMFIGSMQVEVDIT
jgi:hypothetical protein